MNGNGTGKDTGRSSSSWSDQRNKEFNNIWGSIK